MEKEVRDEVVAFKCWSQLDDGCAGDEWLGKVGGVWWNWCEEK
jgi:hypothetical protein